MSYDREAEQFATFLRTLKNRVDRSYEALARRSGVSSSALHRYCAGTSVPTDYGPVRYFAMECGATPPELRESHRLWTLADAARRRLPPETPPERQPETLPERPKAPRLALFAAAALGATALGATAGAVAWRVTVAATARRH